MKYRLEASHQYLRDLRLARRRGIDEGKLNEVIVRLLSGEPLPPHNKDHALTGKYRGFRECHISPDWLLIYMVDKVVRIVMLARTGTHSDLFKR